MSRHELYKKFGPKLLEAIVLIIKDEINILRVAAGLPERTNQNIIDALTTRIENIEDYNWS